MTHELTMSSREITELVESRHDNVKRTIRTLEAKGLVTFTQSEEKSSGGRPGTAFHVNQRDSYVVVAQLCPEFTARLVDRWQELEEQVAQPQLPNFNNPVEAARAFQDWATRIVLPAIRKDGMYVAGKLREMCSSNNRRSELR